MRILPVGVFVTICGAVLGAPCLGAGQDLVTQIQTELQTATFHAFELAQRANTLAGVRLHTHHVINCLEGPKGPDFYPQAANPCDGQGGGIIPDLQTAGAHHVPGAEGALREAAIALTLAKQALGSNEFNEAQPFVLVVARHLQAASITLGK
jgi:hypothetical protein